MRGDSLYFKDKKRKESRKLEEERRGIHNKETGQKERTGAAERAVASVSSD